jgi:hypothetical protein
MWELSVMGQAVTLQQGIWIDQQRLAEAGLHDPLEITVQPGEIWIHSGEPMVAPGPDTSDEAGQPGEPDATEQARRHMTARFSQPNWEFAVGTPDDREQRNARS